MGDNASNKEEVIRIAAGRGPAYPSISLSDAVHRVNQIKDAGASRTLLPPDTIYKIWGFKGASGASRPIMASVGYYGLFHYEGRGEQRRHRLSDLALRIVLDKLPDSVNRPKALREAALRPPVFSKLHDDLGLPPPADVVIEHHLLMAGYSESAASQIVTIYKATLEYAGLLQPANIPPDEPPGEDEPSASSFVDDMLRTGWGSASGDGEMQQAPQPATPRPPPSPFVEMKENELKVALEGDRLKVSAFVDLQGARRLVKRLQANIALLEDELGENKAEE